MHPLLKIIAKQPQLLADHAQAYAELVGAEIARVSTSWKRQAILGAAGLVCAAVTVVLGGMSLLLWAAVPVEQMYVPWLLAVVPAVPAVFTAACLLAMRTGTAANAFDDIKQQVSADMAMLREASEP